MGKYSIIKAILTIVDNNLTINCKECNDCLFWHQRSRTCCEVTAKKNDTPTQTGPLQVVTVNHMLYTAVCRDRMLCFPLYPNTRLKTQWRQTMWWKETITKGKKYSAANACWNAYVKRLEN